LQDPGAMNFIFWLGKPAIIKEEEIEQLKVFLGEHQTSTFNVRALEPGDQVTLQQGAFAGEMGVVEKVGNRKVYIVLESVGLILEATTEAIS